MPSNEYYLFLLMLGGMICLIIGMYKTKDTDCEECKYRNTLSEDEMFCPICGGIAMAHTIKKELNTSQPTVTLSYKCNDCYETWNAYFYGVNAFAVSEKFDFYEPKEW